MFIDLEIVLPLTSVYIMYVLAFQRLQRIRIHLQNASIFQPVSSAESLRKHILSYFKTLIKAIV